MSCHALRGSASWASPGADGGVSKSPAKFKLLAMEGVRCLGAWGCWTCLQHRTGAWVMHIEHQLPRLPNGNASRSGSFRNLGWGLRHGVSSHGARTHRRPLFPTPWKSDVLYIRTMLENFERFSRNRLPSCPEAKLLSEDGVLNKSMSPLAFGLQCAYYSAGYPSWPR